MVNSGAITEKKFYTFDSLIIAERTNGTLVWILSDHLNSSTVTADESGNKLSETHYTAFGEVRPNFSSLGTGYEYTGQLSQMGEIGLYYYVARWLDPVTAHFVSADSTIPDPLLSRAFDRYNYVYSNPINFSDPTGYKTASGDEIEGCHNYYCPNEVPPVIVADPNWDSSVNDEARRYETLANSRQIWAVYGVRNFTVKDYYEYLMTLELGSVPSDVASNNDKQELAARNFYGHCGGFCNPNSDYDLLHYVAIKRLNNGERSVTPDSYDPDTKITNIFQSAITLPKQAWKFGCGNGDVVCDWGNPGILIPDYISQNKTTYKAYDRLGAMLGNSTQRWSTARNAFYLTYGADDEESAWVALTVNQGRCLYEGGGWCR